MSSDDYGSFCRQATRTYSNSLQAKIIFSPKHNYIVVILCFYRKKQHSITIFKSNVIHHGYTVVAVLRGNHLIKEHGSKVGGLYFTEGKENSTNKTIQNYTSHNWIREATGLTGKSDNALNSKDRSQTWVPSLKLKKLVFISPVESVLSKLCVALHGSVCLSRHSWHIRLASLSKSHLHRFICDDLLTLLFPNAMCPETYIAL